MPGTKYKEDPYVTCPYYKKEDPTELKCAGICGDHTISCFKDKKTKEDFKMDFCSGLYWNCPLYIGLNTDGK